VYTNILIYFYFMLDILSDYIYQGRKMYLYLWEKYKKFTFIL